MIINHVNQKEWFVGLKQVEVVDPHAQTAFPMLVMYPSNTPGKIEQMGPFSLEVALDAKPASGRYPLVIISHGSGGSLWVYRTLAMHLASHGYIVGVPEHPFNNRNDNSLDGTVENLTIRPRHLTRAIDYFYESEWCADSINSDTVSVIGHSMGGYTALAAAGGKPTSFPHESPNGIAEQIAVAADPRIRSLVLLAPASVWFRKPNALDEVHLPILLLAAEKDDYTPHFHSQIILEGVKDRSKVEFAVIHGAGHFSFLSPFPEKMRHPAFLPATDPPGFDRPAFHQVLNARVLDFLWPHH
ncbi:MULTISPECIES: alpha/beta hydrolase family protein [Paenibacillus]|uniref:alpha/beta hydrolase family protein n=1 Tax=Paenibacillus TaxID=44249 RepID=UPI002FE28716